MFEKSIFWFRQDLRVYDNRGLLKALENSKQVLPIFVLDTNLIDSFGGLEDKKFGFLREMIENLDFEIKKRGGVGLKVFLGNPVSIIEKLVKKYDIKAIFTNKSYGRYGINRDETIKTMLQVPFFSENDYLLVEPEYLKSYKVFTPYYNVWKTKVGDTIEIDISKINQFLIDENNSLGDFIKQEKHPYFTLLFGKQRLERHISPNYDLYRNDLDKDGTSKLSPYLRFGVFSVRQIYNKAFGVNESFISELAWREFWQHIAYYFPESKNQEFQENKRYINWSTDEYMFNRWCDGKTGYPVVDAAIRQLLETNWMHGRARMIVASFLTKDLHIDWRLGEAFFKKHLLDYDENVNFGNWQWSASVGADPKPIRIFNPCLQSEKFDREAKFIKKYLPELEQELTKSIHNPIDNKLFYCSLLVNHNTEQKIARQMYKNDL